MVRTAKELKTGALMGMLPAMVLICIVLLDIIHLSCLDIKIRILWMGLKAKTEFMIEIFINTVRVASVQALRTAKVVVVGPFLLLNLRREWLLYHLNFDLLFFLIILILAVVVIILSFILVLLHKFDKILIIDFCVWSIDLRAYYMSVGKCSSSFVFFVKEPKMLDLGNVSVGGADEAKVVVRALFQSASIIVLRL